MSRSRLSLVTRSLSVVVLRDGLAFTYATEIGSKGYVGVCTIEYIRSNKIEKNRQTTGVIAL